MSLLLFLPLVHALLPLYTWIQDTSLEGLLPVPRGGHSSTRIGRQLFIFGGCDVSMHCFNDLHSYNTESQIWLRINATGFPPSARGGHSAVLIGTRLIIFGGTYKGLLYNDLFEYDAITNHWKNLLPEGEKPAGRSNHAADVDENGNMFIVGGYGSKGFMNDVWGYNPAYNRWVAFKTAGDAPTPRELHSFNIQGQIGYLFGGFHAGGVSAELYYLDLELMSWTRAGDAGFLPEAREGHSACIIAEFLFVFGGCDFAASKCYNEMYVLDLMTLWWVKLEHRAFTPLPAMKERASSAVVSDKIFTFAGCFLNQHCFNDVMRISTGILCECNGHGECRGGVCVCEKGYSGNDCLIRARCKEDCLARGFCTSSATCDCYPGYKGAICEFEALCYNNCTGPLNGICQADGNCACQKGYTGEDCACQCENGYCVDGGCVCKVGWVGDQCELIDPRFKSENEIEIKPQEGEEEENKVSSGGEKSNDTDTSGNSTGLVTGLEGKEVSIGNEEVEQQDMTGGVIGGNNDKKLDENGTEADEGCESCEHGKCKEQKCYCEDGWTGDHCDTKSSGIPTILASSFTLLSIIIGAIVGYFYWMPKKRSNEPEEFPLMNPTV